MAISYPLSLPSAAGIRNVTIKAVSVTSETRSPFTGDEQIYVHQGQWWEFVVELPPMVRADAEEWISFLIKLNGKEGTFNMYDPDGLTARGVATGTPLVKGGSQTGNSLITDGWTVSTTGILKAGDYIQIGNYMYKVLNDANSDGSGDATLDIWPNLRSSPADNTAITVANCTTLVRLTSNVSEWTADSIARYGATFSCRETL
jgi:hypothetical protein